MRRGAAMFESECVAGGWDSLVARLDRTSVLHRWARAEPALAAIGSVAELPGLTREPDLSRSDEVLGALIRLASVSGGADRDATLVLLHLLSAGVEVLAGSLADLSPDPVGLVVGELTARIRSFGVGCRGGRRDRAIASNLLRDTRRAVLRELRPHSTPKRPHDVDLLVDPHDLCLTLALMDRLVPGPGEVEGLDFEDVLDWARLTGVAAVKDLAVLVASERGLERGFGSEQQQEVAAALGVHPSTLRRRRARALKSMQCARDDYLNRWLAA
jgi:hypothetical protein